MSNKSSSIRIPIRWQWSLLVSTVVLLAVISLAWLILDAERQAWMDSQANVADMQVRQLAGDMTLPMLANNGVEVDMLIDRFQKNTDTVLSIFVQRSGEEGRMIGVKQEVPELKNIGQKVQRLGDGMWYTKALSYGDTDVGVLAVHYSGKAWQEIVDTVINRVILFSLVVLSICITVVYWLAGFMSKPLENLANAASKVANGDFTVQVHCRDNNELGDAMVQFNNMVVELEHKARLRGIFGRYLNPDVIHSAFDEGEVHQQSARHDASILFADMVSFTPFSESSATEDVINALNRHFEVFYHIMHNYGGHVDKYIGDAVMAVFNHPHVHPQHVRQAAMSALGMCMACDILAMPRPDGGKIQFCIGLNPGEVIVGNIGAVDRLEYTVIGNAVNLSARLSSLASAGKVAISRTTFDLLGEGFIFNSIGEKQIKGISKPVECGFLKSSNEIKEEIKQVVEKACTMGDNV
ncbi:MAG: adenylate/guanylate cyclase domain-containing protein [Mariprofundales bacterium]